MKARDLKGLAMFAAVKDVRKCLEGVWVEQGKDKTTLLATTGHIIGALFLGIRSEEDKNFLIPNELLASVKANGADVTWEYDGETVTLRQGSVTTTCASYENHYIDLKRAIPDVVSGEIGYFDAQLVGRVGKAYMIMSGTKGPTPGLISHNGGDTALLDFGRDDFTGCIAPLRVCSHPTRTTRPAWLS